MRIDLKKNMMMLKIYPLLLHKNRVSFAYRYTYRHFINVERILSGCVIMLECLQINLLTHTDTHIFSCVFFLDRNLVWKLVRANLSLESLLIYMHK